MIDEQTAALFWSKIDRQEPDECWPWRGQTQGKGYGAFHHKGTLRRATHISLETDGRSRPTEAHFALHSCDNPPCVNPAHLWWGTQLENIQDALSKGRLNNREPTHCKNGHPFNEANTLRVVFPDGKRRQRCRACALESTRRARRKKKEAGIMGLSNPMRRMLIASCPDDATGEEGCGVELTTSQLYAAARALKRRGLGEVTGPGGSLPGMYWNNRDGLAKRLDLIPQGSPS